MNFETCCGCREDQPNQLAHMDPGGCLYVEDDDIYEDNMIVEYNFLPSLIEVMKCQPDSATDMNYWLMDEEFTLDIILVCEYSSIIDDLPKKWNPKSGFNERLLSEKEWNAFRTKIG